MTNRDEGVAEIPSDEPARPPCDPKYLELLTPADLAEICGYRGPAPISTREMSGCRMGYRSVGTVLVLESPSYGRLRSRLPASPIIRFEKTRGFIRLSSDGSVYSVVIRSPRDEALIIQAPARMCGVVEMRALARRVASRME